MAKFAQGRFALSISDRSGLAFPYTEMVREFVNFYGKNIVKESTLINGVKEFLKWCKNQNIDTKRRHKE